MDNLVKYGGVVSGPTGAFALFVYNVPHHVGKGGPSASPALAEINPDPQLPRNGGNAWPP
jgi:hypothetical protein